MSQYFDLNVPYPSNPNDTSLAALKKTLDLLIESLNHVITGKIPQNHTNPIKPIALLNYDPKDSRLLPLDDVSALVDIRGHRKLIRQISRVTWVIDDTQTSLSGQNQVLNQYDLVAVQPTSEKTLLHACSQMDVDIISIDMSTRLPFHLKHTTLGMAIEKGISFEISYGAALRDSNARKHLISNACSLVRATNGRNIIISSEAQVAMEVRSPNDVINLATFFNLNQADAKNAITKNAKAIMYHADTRKNVFRGVVAVHPN